MRKLKKLDYWLVLILVLAAFLYGYNIWKAGDANQYYTAAIVSMSKSWKAFWYGSFDPASFITVDKPPIALWFMVLCVKIFGFHSWSIVLSSVLFGIGSVYLIYKMVKPYFGRLAANLAALFMTLTPTVVANSRTNNMDATLVFFLLLAGFTLQKAVAKKKSWLVLVAFALIGVSFNIKMLQAFMVLPAMYLFYWAATKAKWTKKLGVTIFSTIALAVFTLAWPLAVDSTSKSSRPYIGSSSTNSVLNLAFGYNGTQRLLGQTTGVGGRFPGMGNKSGKSNNKQFGKPSGKPSGKATGKLSGKPTGKPTGKSMGKPSGKPTGKPSGKQFGKQMGKKPSGKQFCKQMGKKPSGKQFGMKRPSGKQAGMQRPGGKQGGMGANNIFNVGTKGVTRLFQTALGRQISWLLPLSLFGFLLAYYNEWKKKRELFNQRQSHLLYWIAWLLPIAAFFSIAGFFHPYYTIMLAPAIAVLAAIGISSYLENRSDKANKGIFSLGLATTFWLQAYFVYDYYQWLTYLLLAAGFIAIFATWYLTKKNWQKFAVTGLLAAPAFWSLTPTISAESAAVPTADPSLLTSGGNTGFDSQSVDESVYKYVTKHQGSAEYLFATMDSNSAAAYIIKSDKAVMTIGGYNGTDNAITLKQFKQLVKEGKVKYFLLSGRTENSSIITWVKKYGKKVSLSQSQTSQAGPMDNSGTLYDLTQIKQ